MPSACARAPSRHPNPAAADHRLPLRQAAQLVLALSAVGWSLIAALAVWALR